VRNLLKGKLVLIFAFFAALGRLKTVLKRRKVERQEAIRTDREIFSIFKYNNRTKKETFKVLYIDEWGDIHGGGQMYLLNLLKKIDRNKFIPIFVCPSRGTFVDALEEAGVRIEIIKMKRLRNPLNIFSFISSTIKIIVLIKKEKIDFIHSSGAARGTIYAGVAAKIMKIPLIWYVHILGSAGLLNRILAYLSTKIIIIAEAGRKRFSWLRDQTKIVLNYNSIDLEKFNPNISRMGIREDLGLGPDVPVVGTIGILHSRKGQESLLEAAGQVRKEIPDVKFLIVGEDTSKGKSYRIKLENLMKALRLSENVIFTGWLNNIPQVLAGIDVFVLPSLMDHLPLVVLEAMASGKPVVATDVGGVPEMVEDGVSGVLVSPTDVKGLSKAILDLLKDKEKAKKMGIAGRRRTEEFFSIDMNVNRVEQVYRDLLEKSLQRAPIKRLMDNEEYGARA
jgi:glycosyltransferase involved in cell wall biosynthesis